MAIVNGISIYYSVAHWSRSFKQAVDHKRRLVVIVKAQNNVLHPSVDNLSNMLRLELLPV